MNDTHTPLRNDGHAGVDRLETALELLSNSGLDPVFARSQRPVAPSAWHAHVPFASWLVGALRPATIVELGTHNGVSYAAFCEAVMAARLDARCYAVDTWTGDEHAGTYGEEVYTSLKAFHDARYSAFSTLLRTSFDDACARFAAGSIDLLHIDGLHNFEAVSHDWLQWREKLSDAAVVLFHDTNVRDPGFGVWRLWAQLRGRYPSFEFLHGCGLGVLLVGERIPPEVAVLGGCNDRGAVATIRERFAALGDSHALRYELAAAEERRLSDLTEVHARLHDAQLALERHQQQTENREAADGHAAAAERRLVTAARAARRADREREERRINLEREERIQLLEARAAALQLDIEALRTSTSWKVTAPLRWLRMALGSQRARLRLVRAALGTKGIDARRVVTASLRRRARLERSLAPVLPTAVRADGKAYCRWVEQFDIVTASDRAAIARHIAAAALPRVRVLLGLEAGSAGAAEAALGALRAQLLESWIGCILIAPSCPPQVVALARAAVAQDARLSLFEDEEQLQADNELLVAVADTVRLRDHALYVFATAGAASPALQLLYADEDCLSADSTRDRHWFKPSFSPELLRHSDYIGACAALRGAALQGFVARAAVVGIAAALDEVARALPVAAVGHIPMVLFHAVGARPTLRPTALPAPAIKGTPPFVSIIIPTRDRLELLEPCLASIECLTAYPRERMELVVVDNDSTDPATLNFLAHAARGNRLKLLRDPRPFNYAQLNNRAARAAGGEVLVFINNDTLVNKPDWLDQMVSLAQLSDAGAVGARLLYPDYTVQHGGVVLGIHGVAAHAHVGLKEAEGGYRELATTSHEVGAVTGACLAVRRDVFEDVGGFNEALAVAFNDVLLCMDLLAAGRRNLYVGAPLMLHLESKSRGFDDTPEKIAQFRREAELARGHHPRLFKGDPYYNPNLSLTQAYQLAEPPRWPKPWRQFARLAGAPLRVLMLSITHQVGHGVAVVLSLQAEHLAREGFQVFIGGPIGRREFAYEGCERVYLDNPVQAANFAARNDIDVVVIHTPPFFGIVQLLGDWPRSIIYDYGEPPPDLFPDAAARRQVLAEKRFAFPLANRVYAISRSVRDEGGFPYSGVIPLANGHLSSWDSTSAERRRCSRATLGVQHRTVVLNVCRFHAGERFYKGLDTYAELLADLRLVRPDLEDRVVFVLCGKGTEADIQEMEACGLRVFGNVTDTEMVDLYLAADLYMNFSRWEGYNLGIGQALAFGLPVIASDIPAHREFPITTIDDPIEIVGRVAALADDLAARAWKIDRQPVMTEWQSTLETFAAAIRELCAVDTAPGQPRVVALVRSDCAGSMS